MVAQKQEAHIRSPHVAQTHAGKNTTDEGTLPRVCGEHAHAKVAQPLQQGQECWNLHPPRKLDMLHVVFAQGANEVSHVM